jgi:uncharacterized membrane protein YhaH (DUF805 family)
MSDWQYQRDGQAAGPVSDLQLKALAEAGVVTAATLVWKPEYSEWKPLAQTDFPFKSVVQPPPVATPLYGNTYNRPAYSAQSGASSGQRLTLFGYFKRALTQKYVGFEGRARRSEYWGYQLFQFIAIMGFLILGMILDVTIGGVSMDTQDDSVPYITLIMLVLYVIGTFLPSLAITIRRMHDVGVSGWVYLVSFVPYVGGLVIFVITVIDSQVGTNAYGLSPKENIDMDVLAAFT